jgi:DNA-binding transcriptional LysR family regulator
MELRHLRYFVAVAEEKSFRRAAERLHIAQPPLSIQIRKLEEELGLSLFERTSRSVRLSAAGESLLSHATGILTAAEGLLKGAKQIAEGAVGALVIGFLPSTLGPLLAEALRRFRATHPKVQISLMEQRAPQQIEAILKGAIDIGLSHAPAPQPELSAELFSEIDVALALPRGHRLAQKDRINLKSLRGEELVLLRPELACGFYDTFLAACEASGVILPVAQYTNDFVTKLWLVSAGFGISPTMLPSTPLRSSDIVYRPLAAKLPKSQVFLVYRKANQSSLVHSFVDTVRQAQAKASAPPLPQPVPPNSETQKASVGTHHRHASNR